MEITTREAAIRAVFDCGGRFILMDPTKDGKAPILGRNWAKDYRCGYSGKVIPAKPYTQEEVLAYSGPLAVDMGWCGLTAVDIDEYTDPAFREFCEAYPPLGILKTRKGFHALFADRVERKSGPWVWSGKSGFLRGDVKGGKNTYLRIHGEDNLLALAKVVLAARNLEIMGG